MEYIIQYEAENSLFYHKIRLQIPDQWVSNQYPSWETKYS